MGCFVPAARTSLFAVAVLALASALVPTLLVAQPTPVGTAFTYQGVLEEGGVPANGTYDFVFQMFNAPTGGNVVGNNPLMLADVVVTDGLFQVELDFGDLNFFDSRRPIWDGNGRWLEVSVGDPAQVLGPRQHITPTPYAFYATKGTSLSSVL